MVPSLIRLEWKSRPLWRASSYRLSTAFASLQTLVAYSYGPNLPDVYRQSATVDRILKGANPADLPFELPARYELIVNLKTAKTIGLEMADLFVLLADEVIE